MAEDRFEDLGRDDPRRPSAAELLAAGDEAELAAERKLERKQAPRPSSVYSWVVGIVFLLAIIVAGANALRSNGPGALGPRTGAQLPVFAAPTATGPIDADANVKTRAGQPGKTYACDVHAAGAINVCDLRSRPLVMTFMFTRFADCTPELDQVQRLRGAFPQVNFLGVVVKESKMGAAKLVRSHGWRFPVVYDRDGLISDVYGIGGCPTAVFARKGGHVVATRLGKLTDAQMRAQIRRIL